MAVTTSPIANSGGIVNFASGGYSGTGSGTVTLGGLGFVPRRVVVIDTSATDGEKWEWVAGMGTYMFVSGGDADADYGLTESLITTDWGDESVSETGVYTPGTSEPGDGSLIDTTVEIELDVNPPTYEVVLASGLNTNGHVYVWTAEG